MMGKTHIALGMLTATFAGSMLDWPGFNGNMFPFIGALTAVTVGSLAPDVDKPGSIITREVAGPFGKNRITALVGGVVAIYIGGKVTGKIGSVELNTILNLIGIILIVMALIKHRGITHSILGILAAWYAVSALQNMILYQQFIGIPIVIPFLTGYIAHLVADFFSGGIAPLYPFIKTRIKPPISIETGSILDRVVICYAAFLASIVRIFDLSNYFY